MMVLLSSSKNGANGLAVTSCSLGAVSLALEAVLNGEISQLFSILGLNSQNVVFCLQGRPSDCIP
jgi:hypothetical protein